MLVPNLTTDPVWQALLRRRSIRRYTAEPIPLSLVERLLTVATWAPNAHNRQPWRFAVVTDRDRQQRLAQAMAQKWASDLAETGLNPGAILTRAQASQQRIGGAGALVVGCITMAEMDRYPDPARQQMEWLMASQSLALALGQLLLAAHHEGLGACWMCAPLFAPEIVVAQLDLPADWEPQALITLGYPAETRAQTRRPLDDVVVWR